MFGIGFSELILIILAVILFVRPADLPKFFREAGKAWAYVKKGLAEANAVKDAFMKQVDEIAKIDDAPAGKKLIAADDWIEIESARQAPASDAEATDADEADPKP